jgi:GIY-YIG catalytic domain
VHCEGEIRAALYRFYDSRENLLYVGISVDPWRRWREHVLTQPWYPQAKHWTVTWYDTEKQAEAAEDLAIQRERPRHNVAGAIRPPEARLTLSFSAAINALAIWVAVVAVLDMALTTLAIVLHPARPLPFYLLALGWAALAANATLPLAVVAMLLVAFAPLVYRFGCWLERNFGEQARRRSAAEDEARRARYISPVVWVIAPRQTYRVWQRMRTVGPPDYFLALEQDLDDRALTARCP